MLNQQRGFIIILWIVILFNVMDTNELRLLINEMDQTIDGLCYIAIFSDHSGFIEDNFTNRRLGEFNNQEEMMELINNIIS